LHLDSIALSSYPPLITLLRHCSGLCPVEKGAKVGNVPKVGSGGKVGSGARVEYGFLVGNTYVGNTYEFVDVSLSVALLFCSYSDTARLQSSTDFMGI
jgi:hypothetical protein